MNSECYGRTYEYMNKVYTETLAGHASRMTYYISLSYMQWKWVICKLREIVMLTSFLT